LFLADNLKPYPLKENVKWLKSAKKDSYDTSIIPKDVTEFAEGAFKTIKKNLSKMWVGLPIETPVKVTSDNGIYTAEEFFTGFDGEDLGEEEEGAEQEEAPAAPTEKPAEGAAGGGGRRTKRSRRGRGKKGLRKTRKRNKSKRGRGRGRRTKRGRGRGRARLGSRRR
jgi:hypothetical protein